MWYKITLLLHQLSADLSGCGEIQLLRMVLLPALL